jgi:uncharacterized protein YggE
MLFGLVLASNVAVAQENQFSPRHVSVTGTSVARAQPDTVVWQVSIRRMSRNLAEAQAACDETVSKVLAMRSELKLKPEEAQTGYMSIQKIFDRDQFGNTTSFRHFEVVRSVTIRQSGTRRFDEVLTKLVATEDAEVSYHLESTKYHELRAQTRLEAVKAARKKAEDMAELLGAKLGRVLRIAEPRDNWGNQYSQFSNSMVVAPREAEPDEAPGTFAPGSIEIRVSIEVDFEIE